MIEIIIGFIIWFSIGVIAFCWSMEWKIKLADIGLMCTIGLAGPLAIPEAIKLRNMYND